MKISKITILILIFLAGVSVGILTLPKKVIEKPVIKVIEKEIIVGAEECGTFTQKACTCPDAYLEVGCVDDITFDGKVKVKGASEIEIEYTDGTKLKLKDKNYKVEDIPDTVPEI